MYPEVVAFSGHSSSELSAIITKAEVTMEISKEVKEEADDMTEDFQSEVLDLSTKQIPPIGGSSSTLSRSLPLSSPPPPQSTKRRLDPDSDCVSSLELSDLCTNRTPAFVDTTPGGGGFNTGAAHACRALESISPCSTDNDDDAAAADRIATVDSSSVRRRRRRAPAYPSTVPPPPLLLHSLSSAVTHPVASRLHEIPAFLAGHPLNMTAAAVGMNSSLNVFNFNPNCSAGSTLLDCSAVVSPLSNVPLRSADRTAAAITPYAISYFQPSSRRRSKAPRSGGGGGGRWDAAGSPQLPACSLGDPYRAVRDDLLLIGDGAAAAGGGTGGNGDRSQFEERDSAYLERRRKNNEAAKRSRDARRHKEEEIAYRAAKLEQENISLRAELLLLRRESAELHHLLYGRMDPQR